MVFLFYMKRAFQVNNMICIEKFTAFPQLGRFTLRTEGDELTLAHYLISIFSLNLLGLFNFTSLWSFLQGKQLRWEKLLMLFPKSNIFDVVGRILNSCMSFT